MTLAGQTAIRGEAALISARLDRLPTTRYIWKLVLLLSLGGCFEFYDLFLMTYIGPGLVRSGLFSVASVSFFGLTGLASFVAATFAGLFIGTLAFGFAADKLGRRTIFTYSLLWYTVGSIVMACQATTRGILLWRVITGIGIGVELVTIDTYIAELMPKNVRGRAFAVNQVVQFTAIPFVAFISWLLVPRSPFGIDGWRWVVLLGSLGAIFVWFIRRAIPESPRWLIARGRILEAERAVANMEERVAAELGAALPLAAPETAAEAPQNIRVKFSQIFRPPYLRRTLMLMVFHFAQTVGYYGFASWVPTLLIAAGIRTTASLQYSFVIAISAPLGPLLVRTASPTGSSESGKLRGAPSASQRLASSSRARSSQPCSFCSGCCSRVRIFMEPLQCNLLQPHDRLFSATLRRRRRLRVHRCLHARRCSSDRHLRSANARPRPRVDLALRVPAGNCSEEAHSRGE